MALLKHQFDEGVDEACQVSPFFALISGALARHEGREEGNLVPHWSRALGSRPDGGAERLARAKAVLAGDRREA